MKWNIDIISGVFLAIYINKAALTLAEYIYQFVNMHQWWPNANLSLSRTTLVHIMITDYILHSV